MGFLQGFFNNIFGAADNGETVHTEAAGQNPKNTAEANAADASLFAADLSLPPKASREVKDVLYDENNGSDVKIEFSFSLSRDFVDSSTNAGEIDYIAVFAPRCDDEFYGYDGSPAFIVSSAPENEIYDMIDKYKKSGIPEGVYSFERINDMGSKVFFKACTLVRGMMLYFYALDRGISYTNNYIGVMYDKSLHDTPVEQRMIEELDEAVMSYRENILN